MLRVPVTRLRPGEVILDDDAAHYVARVHRALVGDEIVLFDPGEAREARAIVVAVGRDGVRCRIAELEPAAAQRRRPITLLQGLGKGDKFDHIVRDATELSATHIVAVEAARSIVKLGDRREQRLERWRRVASEAARQSRRADAPRVSGPCTLNEALALVQDGENTRCLCLWEGDAPPIGLALRQLSPSQPLAFLVGPEGGLTDAEVETARSAGFLPVSLGPVILRTETVAAAVLGGVLLLQT